MTDRPIVFAGDGFEITAHESAPAHYPDEAHATIQICVPMVGARYNVRREGQTGAVSERDFGARDILLVPAGQPHAVHWLRRAGIVSLQISGRYVHESLGVSRLTLPDFLAVRSRFVTVAATEFYASLGGEDAIAPVFAEALVVGIAHRVATIASRSDFRKSVVVRQLPAALLRRIERYIDDNLERQVSLSELAMLAGLSRWYFLRVFQDTVGMSPHSYVTRRRLDRARSLLCTTSRSVMDIAGEVGMTHSHFSRVFSRWVGITPTEYRRISRQ